MMRPSSPSFVGGAALSTGTVVGAAQVGRYELLLELASGGMATVFIGRQRGAGGFERLVAIKRMHPHIGAIPELAASFMDEARIASLIHHPNVVSVHDVHESDGERLLVMDYVDGVSLASLTKAARKHDRRLPIGVALRIIADALRGLHAAHEQRSMTGVPLQIVHRDATPQNVLLGVDGSVRLTDFGIAKASERTAHTSAGNVKGKFRYMSPEQAMGQAIDRRVDVFAMGAVLWELLSGQRFLKGDSDAEIIHNLAMGNFEPLARVEPSIPQDLSDIIMAAVAESPEHRWPTAEQFADSLDHWARSTGYAATAAEVATMVNELCSPQITSRRQALTEVLQGTRPPVSLGLSNATFANVREPGSYSSSSASFAALSSPNAQTPLPPPPPPRPRWRHPAVLGGAAALVLAGGVALLSASGSSSSASTPPAASSAAPAASATQAPTAPEERITVSLSSDQPITEVKGPGVGTIHFSSDGVTFTLPKGSAPVAVHVRVASGEPQELSLTPTENIAQRLVSGAAKATAKTADPAKTAAGAPPTTKTDKTEKPPVKLPAKLNKSPYD